MRKREQISRNSTNSSCTYDKQDLCLRDRKERAMWQESGVLVIVRASCECTVLCTVGGDHRSRGRYDNPWSVL